MKTLCKITIIVTLLICLVGCKNKDITKNISEKDIKAEAERLVISMTKGDFDEIYNKFTEDTAKKISIDQLEQGWKKTVASIGSYVKHYQTTIEKKEGHFIVKVVSQYEKNGLLNTFTVDDRGQIVGLWTNYFAIPQEDKDYKEVTFKVGKYELSGMLTLPTGVEKPPVVLMIAGSGPQDMNETIGTTGNTPFKDIAHGLAKKGIASLRYDKRYRVRPDLAKKDQTIEHEVLNDVNSAISQLKEDTRIDNNRIIVLGHSLGGMLAPKVSSDNKEVKGIVVMAGTLRNLAEISLDQNLEIQKSVRPKLSDDDKKKMDLQMEKVKADVDKILKLDKDDGKTYLGLPAAYWYSLNKASGMRYIDKINIPMLIMQGSKDFQIYSDKDFELWKEVCGNRKNVIFKLYNNLNHLFMESSGLRTVEDYNAPNKVQTVVIDDIASWVKSIK